MQNILIIHHSRNFEPSNIYLTDDLKEANNFLYGAQELDTWGGIRILTRHNNVVFRIEVCINRSEARLIDPLGNEKARTYFNHSKLKSFRLSSPKNFFKYLDPNYLQYIDPKLKLFVESAVLEYSISFIHIDTQFYLPIVGRMPLVIRSVNFEPLHVLAETEGEMRWIKSFFKLYSEWQAMRDRKCFAISPRDKRYYEFIKVSTHLLPLRHLPFVLELKPIPIPQKSTFLFIGSTYDVLHNKRNLDFVINEIAPKLLAKDPSIKIQIFGNRLPKNTVFKENTEYLGFDKNLREKMLGSTGVIVPFNGGAGMQSKVFEPLTLGAAVIINPRNLAGYTYRKDEDFLPAISPDDYVEAMILLNNNEVLREKLILNSRKTSQKLFSMENYLKAYSEIINL